MLIFAMHFQNRVRKLKKHITQNESRKVIQRLEYYPLIDNIINYIYSNGRTAANTLSSLELLLKL